MDIKIQLDLRVEAVMGALALARPHLPGAGWLDHPLRRRIRRTRSHMCGHEAPRLIGRMLGRTFWVDDLCRLAAGLLTVRDGYLHQRTITDPHTVPAVSGCERFARALREFAQAISLRDAIEEAADIPSEVTAAVGGAPVIADWARYIQSTLGSGPGRIRILPSPLSNAHLGYGPTVITDEGAEAWVIFGPVWRLDWSRRKLCAFSSNKLGRIIRHELGHSSLNRCTAASPDISEFEYLFPPMQPAMRRLGYERWDICLNELILRASEICWIGFHEGAGNAARLRDRELRQGFTLIRDAERALTDIRGVPLTSALPEFLRELARSAKRAAA
jgi:hypothetical protein